MDEKLLGSCDVDESKQSTPPPFTRSKRAVSKDNGGLRHNPRDSPLQVGTTPIVTGGQLMEGNGFKVDYVENMNPSSQRAHQSRFRPLSDIANCGYVASRKAIDREESLEGIEQVFGEQSRSTNFDGFSPRFNLKTQTEVRQHGSEERQNGHDFKISDFKRAYERSNARLNHEYDIEIAHLKHAYKGRNSYSKHTYKEAINSLTLAKEVDMADLKRAHEVEIANLKLHEKCSLPEETSLQQHDEELNHVGCTISGKFAGEAEDGVQPVKNSLDELVQNKQSAVEEVTNGGCRKFDDLQQMKKLNLSDDCPELQKSSDDDGAAEKLEPKQEGGDDKLNAIICGSYADGEAKPKSLYMAMSVARAAVAAVQNELFDCCDEKRYELPDRPSEIFFARASHSSHYIKSRVNRILFDGFENESFNTMLGASKFLDPNKRKEMFHNYYLREKDLLKSEDDINDTQFEEFYEMKVRSFQSSILPRDCAEKFEATSSLIEFGGSDLVATFKSAAKTVWLLHKLAFSFEPPASIFKVADGADLDPNYMESTIMKLDDDERLVPKVGFMIDPGLRLHGEVIRPCDVYLATGEPIPQY
ncbi:unnamed protein product [Calypogeia fissa]